jgi:hypothetical protein
MPGLNWDRFEKLPGGAESNFERLCRALIRRTYGRHGRFAARAAQPGVEFHLNLHTDRTLGDAGRWFGWQCRWYDLPGGKAIGTTRRKKIVKAITTTERELPDLTDWVLWTRRPLTKGDQDWFYKLKTDMRLHLWTEAEVDEHLSGEAAILRETYFGELILTPNTLGDIHSQSVAPVRRRWLPDVHQPVDAEREVRRMLGGGEARAHLSELATQLRAHLLTLEREFGGLEEPLAARAADARRIIQVHEEVLTDVHDSLEAGELDVLRAQLEGRTLGFDGDSTTLPRALRSLRHPASLTLTNAIADAALASRMIDEVEEHLSVGIVAVLADAGYGKTHLAAQLTSPEQDRPAGILLHGKDLHGGQNLDDFAQRVVVNGHPVPSMEALLAALDAAGARAGRRLPLVVDGLNEAEDPRDWKDGLATLRNVLHRYPYVLVVCTLRSAFEPEALPAEVARLDIPGFALDTESAVARYFDHYRIDPGDTELAWELLAHPLTLRLFCEVTNPEAKKVVTIEASAPGSLTAIFDGYLLQAAERIAELAPLTHRYYEQDVRKALDVIGTSLWQANSRGVGEGALRTELGDDARPWNESIVRALEQEGVILRVPGEAAGSIEVIAAYDALGGNLIADAVIRREGLSGLQNWLSDATTSKALQGNPPERHALADDIFRALVGLVPRRLPPQQLWPILGEPLRPAALRGAAGLEGTYLDAQTVDQLSTLVTQQPSGRRDLLSRLYQTRGAPSHPLNAEFLDRVLRPMEVAERDLRWTEWIRKNSDEIRADLRRLGSTWRNRMDRSEGDRLRARWVMWTLTSTVNTLRDEATLALYWFGRGDSDALFALTLDALEINDPYVSERLLAASYGVCMAHQVHDSTFGEALAKYVDGLETALIGPNATHPTNHWLARLHAQGAISLAAKFYPSAVPKSLTAKKGFRFASGPSIKPLSSGKRADEVDRTLQMDFENYTLGRLIDDRSNYDMKHVGHIAAVAHVRGVVWSLGWREDNMGAVDKVMGSLSHRTERGLIERYGKKYGWIGFYTFAGILDDKNELADERLSDLHIDPSFPESPAPVQVELPVWARVTPKEDRKWIRKGLVKVPDQFFYPQAIQSHQGPWVAVGGFLESETETAHRRVWGLLTAVLVHPDEVPALVEALESREHPGRWWLPEAPDDYYTFAGEIPWSDVFTRQAMEDGIGSIYQRRVALDDATDVEAEILFHRFSWESYHSELNQAGGTLVPSKEFSHAFDLRSVPQGCDQVLPDGSFAAISRAAPEGFDGHVLYLREDLVSKYAKDRALVWFIWGERQIYPLPHRTPDWIDRARAERADVWRTVQVGTNLSPRL